MDSPLKIHGQNPGELFGQALAETEKGLFSLSTEELQAFLTDFDVTRLIDRGGTGSGVFLARQPSLDRLVAIKVLTKEATLQNDRAGERFAQEARTMAQLRHPNIAMIHDFIEVEGIYCIIMEYIEGESLLTRLERAPLSFQSMISITEQICEALSYAHEFGILHRDLKPANILLTSDNQVKIVDFGIAKFFQRQTLNLLDTREGTIIGTPHYMAPEQQQGSSIDQRSDIYSLGIVMYEMLTGKVPQGRFRRPSKKVPIKPWIDPIVLKALDEDPKARHRSITEIQTSLHRGLKRHPITTSQTRPIKHRRAKLRWGLIALGLTLLSGFISLLVHYANTAPSPKQRTNSLGMRFVPIPSLTLEMAIWETRVQDFTAFMTANPDAKTGTMRSPFLDEEAGSWDSPRFQQRPDHPVIGVTYQEAQRFCQWLNQSDSNSLPDGWHYRLPSVAEWKTALGAQGRYPWGDRWSSLSNNEAKANLGGDEITRAPGWPGPSFRHLVGYDDKWSGTNPVDYFPPNQFGLFGMSGNVSEWCQPPNNQDPHDKAPRLGGSWASVYPNDLDTQAPLTYLQSDSRVSYVGFRIVLAPKS